MWKKLFFNLILSILIVWLIFPLVRWSFHIEFASQELLESYNKVMFYLVPILVLLTLVGTIKPQDRKRVIGWKIFGTIGVAAVAFFLMLMVLLSGLCSWSNDSILFINKEDPSSKIMVRSFGCGAWDSSEEESRVAKVNQLTSYFIHVEEIDTLQLDKEIWIRVME